MNKLRVALEFYVISEGIGEHTDRFVCHLHEQCDRGGNFRRKFLGAASGLEELHKLLPVPGMTRSEACRPFDGPRALEIWM